MKAFIHKIRQSAIEEVLMECIGKEIVINSYDWNLFDKGSNSKRKEIINLAETKYGVKL